MKKLNIKKILVIVLGIALVVWLFGGRSAKKTAKQYIEALYAGNASKCASLMTEKAIEDTGAPTKKVFISDLNDALDDLQEEYQNIYGSKWKYSVKVIDIYDYDAGDAYDDQPAKMVELKITHKGSGLLNKKEGEERQQVLVVKQGLKWYVANIYQKETAEKSV